MDRSELEALVAELRAPRRRYPLGPDAPALVTPPDELGLKAADAIEALLQQDMAPSGEQDQGLSREPSHTATAAPLASELAGQRVYVSGIGSHEPGCPLLRSATCSVAIECEHGWDCCPICDRCTCGPFQARVLPWMLECFGPVIPYDKQERGDRLLEEVLELLQSGGYDPARVAALRDYVWGRPVGQPSQEAGGVMVTLAAYCIAHGLDMAQAGETELARVWTKVDAIRAKQAAKPTGSALPVALPDHQPSASGEGWRPISEIETTWREDGPILGAIVVANPGGGLAVGEAHFYGESEGWWWAGEHGTYHGDRIYPTLYQPLPDPPKPTAAEGGDRAEDGHE